MPAHTAISITEFLVKKNIPTLAHPLYSSDLAPCDFYLFPKLKSKLKGFHFGTVTDELRTLIENDFRYCYYQWKERWNHCVTSQGHDCNIHLNKTSVHLLLGHTYTDFLKFKLHKIIKNAIFCSDITGTSQSDLYFQNTLLTICSIAILQTISNFSPYYL
jgi:hypothetical protein